MEMGRTDDDSEDRQPPPVGLSAVPINVGPALWHQVWSQLDALVCTSATLTVFGQGFDFFLGRVRLESERLAAADPLSELVTRELPHAFDYHNQALLMLPGDLPSPRDSDLRCVKRTNSSLARNTVRFRYPDGEWVGIHRLRDRLVLYSHCLNPRGHDRARNGVFCAEAKALRAGLRSVFRYTVRRRPCLRALLGTIAFFLNRPFFNSFNRRQIEPTKIIAMAPVRGHVDRYSGAALPRASPFHDNFKVFFVGSPRLIRQ
jgi:hypothetical protein